MHGFPSPTASDLRQAKFDLRFLKISSWPILLKTIVAPASGILLLTGIIWLAANNLSASQEHVRLIVRDGVDRSVQLLQVSNDFRTIEGDLFKFLTSVASDQDRVDIATETARLTNRLEVLEAKIQKLNAGFENGTSSLTELAQSIGQYREAINVVSSMLELDFGAATSFLDPFKDISKSLAATIDDLVANGVQVANTRAKNVDVATASSISTMLWSGSIGLVVVVLVSAGVSWELTNSIHRIANATTRVAKGDNSVRISRYQRGDALGKIVQALQSFIGHMEEAQRLQKEQAETRSREIELEAEREREEIRLAAERRQKEEEQAEATRQQRHEERTKLASDFEASVKIVLQQATDAAATLKACAEGLADRTDKSLEQTSALGHKSTEVVDAIQTIAGATEELKASIQEIAERVVVASNNVNAAVSQSDKTETVVREMANAANHVGQITKLISDIAGQTSLLALNATIEASRAGDAGRGFAVVASEVKELATQADRAANEIAAQINHVQSSTKAVVSEIAETRTRIRDAGAISSEIAAAIHEQNAAVDEISRTASLAADLTQDLAATVADVEKDASQNEQAAIEMTKAMTMLENHFDALDTEADNFVTQIKS